MNNQKPFPLSKYDDHRLEVFKIFPSIQGEGPLAGFPATFVRLTGCNLQCPACDTAYTENALGLLAIDDIVARVVENGHKLVVLTGGEPLRQHITPLILRLQALDFQVQIETNGTLPAKDIPYGTVLVCSPKGGVIHPSIGLRATAFKYVIQDGSVDTEDGLPITVLENKVRVARPPVTFKGVISLQPLDAGDEVLNKRNLQAAIKSCMTFGYTLGLQLHKIINME